MQGSDLRLPPVDNFHCLQLTKFSVKSIKVSKDEPSIGHQKEDLIVKATFDNQLVNLTDFELIRNARFGNCYTFNKNNNMKTRRALPGYGEFLKNISCISERDNNTYLYLCLYFPCLFVSVRTFSSLFNVPHYHRLLR